MSDFLTNTKESQVLTETPRPRYLAVEVQNYHVLYQPGFNRPAFERIKLVRSSASVPSNRDNPFQHFLHSELQFKYCG